MKNWTVEIKYVAPHFYVTTTDGAGQFDSPTEAIKKAIGEVKSYLEEDA